MNQSKRLSAAALILGCSISLFADNWAHWRGPHFTGASDEKNLPSTWSKTEGVAWSADMPSPSAASPIIWEDSVFVSSADTKTKSLHAFCFDRKTGKIRWQRQTGEGYQRDEKSNFASPSPVTDGQKVIFFYGTGDLAAFDFAGNKLWSRNIQKDYGQFAFQWTFSSGPTLHDGKLYMQILQRDVPVNGRGRTDGPNESYLLALDPATGKEIWRHVRPSDAVGESKESYATPILFQYGGRDELLIAGGDCITGHDPATGKELWRWGTWNPNKINHWRLVPSPVAGDGIILASAPKGSPIYAVKAGLSGKLDDSAIAWKTDNQRELSSDVPTPLFYMGDFFVLGDSRKALSRVEPKTGKEKWSIELPGRAKYEASPVAGDGKIYFMNFAGLLVVVNAEDGKVISQIPMGEERDDMIRSSISISQGQLFIRTNSKLYCIGQK